VNTLGSTWRAVGALLLVSLIPLNVWHRTHWLPPVYGPMVHEHKFLGVSTMNESSYWSPASVDCPYVGAEIDKDGRVHICFVGMVRPKAHGERRHEPECDYTGPVTYRNGAVMCFVKTKGR
jgi:hypothetical protein